MQGRVCADREAGLVEEPAAKVRRREDLEVCLGARRRQRLRALPEDVQEAEHDQSADEPEQHVADRAVEAEAGELAVPVEDDPIRDVGHETGFGRGPRSPA